MPRYVITRKTGNKEYYLENIYFGCKMVWVTSKDSAMHFENETYLKQFISREFPGKGYYISSFSRKGEWSSIIILPPSGMF
jgi:hypothetical protein